MRVGRVYALSQLIKLAGYEIRLRFEDRNTTLDKIVLGRVLLRPSVIEVKEMHSRKRNAARWVVNPTNRYIAALPTAMQL